ncbi:leucyl aminopeptidase [Candidatus Woesearchaeota archaeon]|nr:MAG: leucyl aminopeptidase [Candidatus Woesearchaeota archaeon]
MFQFLLLFLRITKLINVIGVFSLMDVRLSDDKLVSLKTPLLALACFESESMPDHLKDVDKALQGEIAALFESGNFKGELNQWRIIGGCGRLACDNVLLFGLGKKNDASLEILRRASGTTASLVRDKLGLSEFAIAFHMVESGKPCKSMVQAEVEGVLLGSYRYLKYKTVREGLKSLKSLVVAGKGFENEIEKARVLAECANLTRDLQNDPASDLTPEKLADAARELEKFGVSVQVFDKKQIEALGLTALLAVNRGSVNEPRFVVMEYDGGGKRIALIGKGITFDSGGLDIKPADGMLSMRMDMSGAAVVIGALRAAAMLKLKAHLFGVFAATENMPGNNAYKPGDVVPTYSGKTIEIANTDAEGRVVLADALAYSEKHLKPEVMIDFATLTGACVVALGSVCAGVMGDDQSIIDALKNAGEATGERVWQLPFYKEYLDQVKSEVADVRNLGIVPRQGGAITAGAFLKAFVEKTPWAHIDIAGPAWADKSSGYTRKGGTGFGVRLAVEFIERWK